MRQEEKCVNSEFWKSASTLYNEIARKSASRGKLRQEESCVKRKVATRGNIKLNLRQLEIFLAFRSMYIFLGQMKIFSG